MAWTPPDAEWQQGVFTERQAQEAGLTPHLISRRIKDGAWQRVAGRGWMLAGPEPNFLARAQAGMLTWPDGGLWGPTALLMWSLVEGWDPPPPVDDRPIHMAVPYSRPRQPGLMAHVMDMGSSSFETLDPKRLSA